MDTSTGIALPCTGIGNLPVWVPTLTNPYVPKPIRGVPVLKWGLLAFLVFSSVTHKIGLFSPKNEALSTPENDDADKEDGQRGGG